MHAYDDEPPRGRDVTREVWIVDDDKSIRWVLEKTLSREQVPFKSFASASEALSQLDLGREPPQVLLSDIRMPGESGLDLLKQVKERFPSLPVIIMTAYSDLDSAVAAFQGGAFEYLPKPFDVDQALETLAALPALPYGIFAQGHGDAYPQADLAAVVVTNRERILHIRQLALAAVEEPQEASQVLKFVADELSVAITQPAIYYLTRTTIHACLNSLRQSGRVDLKLVDNRLLWTAIG